MSLHCFQRHISTIQLVFLRDLLPENSLADAEIEKYIKLTKLCIIKRFLNLRENASRAIWNDHGK